MENNVSFKIKDIQVINFGINAPTELVVTEKFHFELQFRAMTKPPENIIAIFSDVVVKDAIQNIQMGRYSAVFHYEVESLGQLLSGAEIAPPLLSTLLGISVSTLRGLLFESFRGTFLHHAILPVVDITAIQAELV